MISNILIQLNMGYCCDVCDKTFKLKSKNNHLKCLIHIPNESFRTNDTIKNPNFFDVDKTFNDYITNHKKIDLCLFKFDFKLVFKNFAPHINPHFHHNTSNIILKRYLLYCIE